MTGDSTALLIVVWLPLLVAWIVVLSDLFRRSDLTMGVRLVWGLLCTLLWPALIVYLLVRPTRGRLELAEHRSDRQARLVSAVLDHESGRLTDDEMTALVRNLRTTSGASSD